MMQDLKINTSTHSSTGFPENYNVVAFEHCLAQYHILCVGFIANIIILLTMLCYSLAKMMSSQLLNFSYKLKYLGKHTVQTR